MGAFFWGAFFPGTFFGIPSKQRFFNDVRYLITQSIPSGATSYYSRAGGSITKSV